MAARGVGAWGSSRGLLWGVSCARVTGGATRGGRCARRRLARHCRVWRRPLGLSLPPAQPGPLRRGCGPAACALGGCR